MTQWSLRLWHYDQSIHLPEGNKNEQGEVATSKTTGTNRETRGGTANIFLQISEQV